MNIDLRARNKFEFELRDGATGELKQTAVAYNIIVDNFFTYIMKGAYTPIHSMDIGTGTGTISATRSSLFNRVYNKYLNLHSEA